MEWNGYQLSNPTIEDIDGLVEVTGFLWGNDEASNKDYFIWKHQRNPLMKKPASIVAKHGGKVAGFLGYVPVEWKIDNTKLMMLLLSDAVVHPEHRRKGLLSGMIKAGMQLYCHEYNYFAAFTANDMAAPAYLKFGWKPLVTGNYLRHFSLPGLIREKLPVSDKSALEPGNFGEIEVSGSIRLFDIARIGNTDGYSENKMRPNKTPDFFKWKLSNPRDRYTYLYHLVKSEIDAYLILRVQRGHAHVFDYGQERGSLGIQKLISFILDKNKFSSISFFNAGAPAELKAFLEKKHFNIFSLIDRLRYKESYHIPILVRPAVENYSDDDWFTGDIDIRDIDNWNITEICFD